MFYYFTIKTVPPIYTSGGQQRGFKTPLCFALMPIKIENLLNKDRKKTNEIFDLKRNPNSSY